MKLVISKKFLIVSIVALIAISAIWIGFSGILSDKPEDRVEVDISNFPTMGSPDAKVTIAIFTDFECPFCGRFARDTLPLIISEYVDSGQAKVALGNFPLQGHVFAQKAAEAGECANEQGKFWEYHDILFSNQERLYISDLKKYASQLNMSSAHFDQCLDSGKYSDKVKSDRDTGIGYGVSSTPTIFINGIRIEGAYPFLSFKQVIDSELALAGA